MAKMDKKPLKKEIEIFLLSKLVLLLFNFTKNFLTFKNINEPRTDDPVLYAIWHGHQCCIYSLPFKEKLNVLISASADGQIISNVLENWGYKIIRGSSKRRGSESTLKIIKKIKTDRESVAINIDGPRGPKHVVKKGIIKIAKLTGAPIIPVVWHSKSKTFLKFKTWDDFTFPLASSKLLVKFGDPIYVDENGSQEEDEHSRLLVENSLKQLFEEVKEEYPNYY